MQALVDAEFEVLRFIGVDVYPTDELDGKDPRWCPRYGALLTGTDITPEDAESAVSGVVALLADSAWAAPHFPA